MHCRVEKTIQDRLNTKKREKNEDFRFWYCLFRFKSGRQQVHTALRVANDQATKYQLHQKLPPNDNIQAKQKKHTKINSISANDND